MSLPQVTAENFHDEVLHHHGPVVIGFGWEGCPPCRVQAKFLEQLAATGVKVMKSDIVNHPELATEFNISSVPVTIFFARGAPRISYNGIAKLPELQANVAEAVTDGNLDPQDHEHSLIDLSNAEL